MSRRESQPNFAQINTWQDRRQTQQKEDVAFAEGYFSDEVNQTVRDLFADADPEAKAWVDDILKPIRKGRRARGGLHTERYNSLANERIIPQSIARDLNHVLGLEDNAAIQDPHQYKTRPDGHPVAFDIEQLAKELDCDRQQAVHIIAFTVLFTSKYDITNMLEWANQIDAGTASDTALDLVQGIDIDRLRKVFRNKEFMTRLTNEAMRRSLPTLVDRATIQGVQHLVNHSQIFFKQDPTQSQLLRDGFSTTQRKDQFIDRFKDSELAIDDKLQFATSYEFLFGEMTREEFLGYFPNWQQAHVFRWGMFQRRYRLEIAENSPTAEVVSEEEVAEVESMSVPEEVDSMRHPLRNRFRWAALAAALVVAAVGSQELFDDKPTEESKDANRLDDDTTVTGPLFTGTPSLEQPSHLPSNNLSPERLDSAPIPASADFVSVPSFNGMRATEVYTHIGENGLLTYDSDYDFQADELLMTDENSTRHVLVERVRAQGTILYPPEMGKVDSRSIYVQGYTPDQYTIEPGEQGRYRVVLHEPSDKPFLIAYEVLAVKPGAAIPYNGELPPIPTPANKLLTTENERLNIEKQPDEDELEFILRAAHIISQQTYYPRTEQEKGLSFNDAVRQNVNDCDVANQRLVEIGQRNGIRIILVGDTDPMPGRENHATARAIVYSQRLDKHVVVRLDATPWKSSPESRESLRDLGGVLSPANTSARETVQVEDGVEAVWEDPSLIAKQELLDLAAQYEAVRADMVEAGVTLEDVDPGLIAEAFKRAKQEVAPPADATTVSESGKSLESFDEWYNTQVTQQADTLVEVTDEEWKALGRGLYGYAEFMLNQNDIALPENAASRVRVISAVMVGLMDYLSFVGVIPKDVDPYEWSRQIEMEDARRIAMWSRSHNYGGDAIWGSIHDALDAAGYNDQYNSATDAQRIAPRTQYYDYD